MAQKQTKSISKTIILGITLLVIGLQIALGTTIYLSVRPINENQFTDKLSTTMRLTDSTIGAYFDGISNYASMLSVAANNLDEYEIQELEQMIVESNESITSASISFINAEYTVSYPDGSKEYEDCEDAEWFGVAQDQAEIPYFSPIYENENGDVVIACALTAYDSNYDITAVVMVEFLTQSVGNLVGNETTMGNIKFYMTDIEGNIVLDPFSPISDIHDTSYIKLDALRTWTPGVMSVVEEEIDDEPYEIRMLPSINNAMVLDYIMLIPKSEITDATNKIIFYVVIALIIGVTLSLAISILLAKSITNPLKKIIDILRNIADGDGDLTVRLPHLVNNELGQLAAFFNQTIEKIANSMRSVIHESSHMQEVGGKLSINTSQSATAIEQMTANIDSMRNEVSMQSDSVDQTNTSITNIADNITSLNQNISVQTQTVSQSSAAVEEMVANIKSVSDILEKNQENVVHLQESADKGRTVVSKTVEMTSKIAEDSEGLLETAAIIQQIASQTNLLAMNAAIEAAHAGEAGRGFAVVADEIRKLAEDSNRQGKKITGVLKSLREMIISMTQNSTELKKQFDTIFDHTSTVSTQEGIIKTAMEEQNEGSKQVIDAMNQINSITSEVRSNANEMQTGSKEVIDQMERLSKVTVQINSAMQEISNGINSLNTGMQEVNSIGQENARSIDKVSSEINKFKVEPTDEEASLEEAALKEGEPAPTEEDSKTDEQQ